MNVRQHRAYLPRHELRPRLRRAPHPRIRNPLGKLLGRQPPEQDVRVLYAKGDAEIEGEDSLGLASEFPCKVSTAAPPMPFNRWHASNTR